MKSKTTTGLLALLLGGLGFHKFYLGSNVWGVVYFLFCWTFIPSIVGFVEGIIILRCSDEEFNKKYNGGNDVNFISKDDVQTDKYLELEKLKSLHIKKIITDAEFESEKQKILLLDSFLNENSFRRNKMNSIEKDKVYNNKFIVSIVILILCGIYQNILGSSGSIVFMLLFWPILIIPIWYMDDLSVKNSLIERMKNFKQYRRRSIASVIIVFFAFMFGIMAVIPVWQKNKQQKEKAAFELERKNHPEPIINIISSTGNVANVETYLLDMSFKNTDKLILQGKEIEFSGDSLKREIRLEKPETKISITASNYRNTTSKSFIIKRNENEIERQTRLRNESEIEAKKQEEDRKKEKSKKEYEESIKLMEKEVHARTQKKEKIEKRYNNWLKEGGYLHEKEEDLFDWNFKQTNSEFSTAPDGSKQVEMTYVGNEDDCTVMVKLQYAYVNGRYFYSVNVNCN